MHSTKTKNKLYFSLLLILVTILPLVNTQAAFTNIGSQTTQVNVTAGPTSQTITLSTTQNNISPGVDSQTISILTPTQNVTVGTNNQTLSSSNTTENLAVGENTQALTSATSTENVVTGTNNQAISFDTTTPNTNEVKASRTLGVNTVPADGETMTIGTCVITFSAISGSTSDELNCTDEAAIIDLNMGVGNSARTAIEIATALASLTNLSDGDHGILTKSSSGSSATFTTRDTEGKATEITFVDGYYTKYDQTTQVCDQDNVCHDETIPAGTLEGGTNGKIVSTASVAGVVPIAQVSTATPSNVENGDTFTLIINGASISYRATVGSVSDVTAGLTSAINTNSTLSQIVTATDQTIRVDITSKTAGSAFTLVGGTSNRNAVSQISSLTPANVETGDTYTAIVNGITQSFTATAPTAANVTAGLTAAINNNSSLASVILAVDQSTRIDLIARSAGTPFTVITGTSNRNPLAQVTAVTPTNVEIGDIFTVTVNNVPISFTATAATVANVTAGLTLAINSDSTLSSVVLATNQTTRMDVSSKTAGVPFTLSTDIFNRLGVSQVSTITPANVEQGDTFYVVINGTEISYTAQTGSVSDVTTGLASMINSSSQNSNVAATNQTTRVDVQAKTAGTAFTISGNTANRPPVVQLTTATIGSDVDEGDVFALTLPGSVKVEYTAKSGDTNSTVAGELYSKIQSSTGYAAQVFTSSVSGNVISFSGKTINAAFEIIQDTSNRSPVAQVETVTLSNLSPGENVNLTINGIKYSYFIKGGDTITDVIAGFKTLITDANIDVSGTQTIILTAKNPGTGFVLSADVSGVSVSDTTQLVGHNYRIATTTGTVYAGDITKTTAKIIWTNTDSTLGDVYISKKRSNLKRKKLNSPKIVKVTDSTLSTSHNVYVYGLKSKSVHYYRIVTPKGRSMIFSFKTKK